MTIPKKDRDALWETVAKCLPWFKQWDKVLEWNEPIANWFVGGTLNASYACVDVNAKINPTHKAIEWCNEHGKSLTLTYEELYKSVNKCAAILSFLGVKKGDIVVIYMPMIPQAIVSMLAVARLGAIHSVVFSGFSANALKDRITDAQATYIITCDSALYRGKKISIKDNVDIALKGINNIKKVLVLQRETTLQITLEPERDILWHEISHKVPDEIPPCEVESSHPLFILYTSGTTGKPKGIVHSTGGYLTYVYATIDWAFSIKKDSIYWCTADIGWITGHSYVTYGPLLHGATIVLYEGAPDYPTPDRWWGIIQKYKVSIFYTSPTALRMFIKYGEGWISRYDLSSLKVLGSVGEPINPEVWQWYYTHIGKSKCPVIDTWWQTETGGFMIAPTAGLSLVTLKPGSATFPLPGITAQIVDPQGNPVPTGTKGHLIITSPWPGMSLGIHNDQERFKKVYWGKFKGVYYSYDYAKQDKDGYFWLLGRADEVLNIAGHRIGTAEIESATLTHKYIAEVAAIGAHDEIKGERIVLFVVLKTEYNTKANDTLKESIINTVRKELGAFVTPSEIYFINKLPKTRSGKIMRRVLKAVVEKTTLGDLSTLEDSSSIEEIKNIYENFKNILESQ